MNGDTIGKTSRNEPDTDWRRLHEMTDKEVEAAIADDPGLQPLGEELWRTAQLVGRPSRSSRSTAGFNRAVTRITVEACWLHRYQISLDKLKSQEVVGTDFFRVAFIALQDARLVRLIRLLDENSRTASFWYLHRVNRHLVDSAALSAGLDLCRLKDISAKLRTIRNGTFIHIDKHHVFEPQTLYQEAAIEVQDISSVGGKLFETMKEIHRVAFDRDFEYDEYDGSDIAVLARLRDAAEAQGSEKQSEARR